MKISYTYSGQNKFGAVIKITIEYNEIVFSAHITAIDQFYNLNYNKIFKNFIENVISTKNNEFELDEFLLYYELTNKDLLKKGIYIFDEIKKFIRTIENNFDEKSIEEIFLQLTNKNIEPDQEITSPIDINLPTEEQVLKTIFECVYIRGIDLKDYEREFSNEQSGLYDALVKLFLMG